MYYYSKNQTPLVLVVLPSCRSRSQELKEAPTWGALIAVDTGCAAGDFILSTKLPKLPCCQNCRCPTRGRTVLGAGAPQGVATNTSRPLRAGPVLPYSG